MTETKTCCAVKQNPQMLLLLGACPALAVTTGVISGAVMGVAILVIMLLTGIVVSLLKKLIASVKLPACVLIAAGFTALVQMVLAAWLPDLYYANGELALYLSVIAVSPFVYRHADKVASAASLGETVKDAVLSGLLLLVVMLVVSALREVLGSAMICGKEIAFMKDYTISILAKPFGGFVILGIVAAVVGAVCPASCCCKEGE